MGFTLLILASFIGAVKVVRMLLQKGVEVDSATLEWAKRGWASNVMVSPSLITLEKDTNTTTQVDVLRGSTTSSSCRTEQAVPTEDTPSKLEQPPPNSSLPKEGSNLLIQDTKEPKTRCSSEDDLSSTRKRTERTTEEGLFTICYDFGSYPSSLRMRSRVHPATQLSQDGRGIRKQLWVSFEELKTDLQNMPIVVLCEKYCLDKTQAGLRVRDFFSLLVTIMQ